MYSDVHITLILLGVPPI